MVYKYAFAAAVAVLYSLGSLAQTVMTYGANKVSKDEFWRAYSKNKTENLKNEKAIMDYADLYANFKLKVQAAQDMRLDTLPHIKSDAENFRAQILESYLADDASVKMLQQQAFERSQKDLHVIHYSIPFGLVDSASAKSNINKAYDLLLADKTIDAAKTPGLKMSDMGYLTVFSVPYEYENILYNTKPGTYSKPFARGNAWHIFKIADTRPASGTWKVAQILFSLPPNATQAEKQVAKKRADSVYNLLQQGLSFSQAAFDYSNDRITNMAEGILPEFGTGKYDKLFEDNVFALKEDGTISKPFLTDYGYHIVKRISVKEIPSSNNDAEYMYELKQKINGDSRMALEKEKYEDQIVTITGFKIAPGLTSEGIINILTDSLRKPIKDKRPSNFTIASFKDGNKIPAEQWIAYAKEYNQTHEPEASFTNKNLWKEFVKYSALQDYKANLEYYSPDFKYQLKEFKDGNMLFEVMDKKVWGKAAADEAALRKYYEAHKTKYTWNESADAIIFNCTSKQMAEEALATSKKGSDWKNIMLQMQGNVVADSGRFELDQLIARKNAPNPTPGSYSEIVQNPDGIAAFILYKTIYPAGQIRGFEDARGLVINDYQDVLEKEWMESLKKKYPLTINTAALKELSK